MIPTFVGHVPATRRNQAASVVFVVLPAGGMTGLQTKCPL